MFERPHHRRIAKLLGALDAAKLASHHCFFGGGTAIALLHGEYRESRDVDFLISELPSDKGRIPLPAWHKAGSAYSSIEADLAKAQAHIERPGRLVRCMANLQMTLPPALVLDRIRKLRPR